MNRKTVILIAAVAVLMGLAAYLFFALEPAGPGQPSPFGNLPIIGGRAPIAGAPTPPPAPPPGAADREGTAARLRQIIAKDILAPTLSADQRSLYYVERSSGHLMRSDLDGNGELPLTNLTVLETFDGLWSPLKTRVALSYHEGDAVKRFIEGAATGTPSAFLPSGVVSFAWSPDGKSSAYLLPQNERTNLATADQSGKNGRTVFSTPVPDLTVQWVSKNTLLLVSRPSGLAPSLILSFDLPARRADPILTGARGVVALPLPDGSGFVFSQSSGSGEAQALALYTFKGGNVAPLNVTTIAEKCAAAVKSKKLYCGVPAGIIRSPSPDEWYRGAVSLSDAIAAIDLATGAAAPLMQGEADVDVVSPFVPSDERYLFFQNKKDGTLWRLTLP